MYLGILRAYYFLLRLNQYHFTVGRFFSYRDRARIFNVFAYILETNEDFYSKLYKHIWPSCKTPEAGTGGCTWTARGPQATMVNNNHLALKFSVGQMYYTSTTILSKSGPNRSSSSRENAKKTNFSLRYWRYRDRKNLAARCRCSVQP